MTDQQPTATVTITAQMLEAALRSWMADVDYDIHKSIQCGEEDGEDTYPDETETVFAHLQRLAAEAGAAEEQPRPCGRCNKPFDPTDTRWDGRAEHNATGFCRSCVDRCHESTDAFHRCAICES